MRKLQIVLSKQQKLERVLGNLEQMKERKEVSQQEYDSMVSKYESVQSSVAEELQAIRNELASNRDSVNRDIEDLKTELRNMELSHKVGEIDLNTYQKKKTKLEKRLGNAEARIGETSKLLHARTAAEVGGYVDVSLNGDSEGVLDKIKNLDLGSVGTSIEKFQSVAKSLPIPSIQAGNFSKVGVLGNAFIALGVFLPAVSIPMFGSPSLQSIGQMVSGLGRMAGESVPFLLVNAWWILLVLGVAGIASNFVLGRLLAKPAMLLSGAAVVVGVGYGIVGIAGEGDLPSSSISEALRYIGFGVYTILAGGIMSLVAGLRFKRQV